MVNVFQKRELQGMGELRIYALVFDENDTLMSALEANRA
jgi:hypothetical protein